MRIAFTANHRRTLIFAEAAKHLQTLGHEVFWIATGSGEVSSILASFDNVLTIDRSLSGGLADFEKYSEITVKGIIASDRILRGISYNRAVSCVSSFYSQIRKFLSENQIELVFGEVTWAHEMIAAGICRELGIEFLSPANIRYPSDRFAFFRGVFQKEIVRTSSDINISEGINLYDRFINCGSEPFYMKPVQKPLSGKLLYHAERYLKGDTKDMTVPPVSSLIYKTVRRFIRHRPSYSRPEGRFVYLPLQCSPESSLDVQAGYYVNQPDFVRAVSRSTPNGTSLAVKPHPLGLYSRRFFKELLRIPGVQIVNADSGWLIDRADAVISISSTACYEAGLSGIPAVVFSDVFFTELPTVIRCESPEKLADAVKEATDAHAEDHAVKTFLAKLYSASYEGFCESPDVYADALSLSNISKVCRAFEDIVRYCSSKSETAESICSR